MKKLAVLVLFALLLNGCASEAPGETTARTEGPGATEIGTSSYSCVTGESETQQTITDSGTVWVKAFSHRVYDPNGEYVVTLTTTVIGTAEDGTAVVSAIRGNLSDAQADGFTVSEHISGDTGTIVLYRNQMSVCHFQYRILSDGSVKFL